MTMFTVLELSDAVPLCQHPERWIGPLNHAMARWGINRPKRIALFVALTAVASQNYSVLTENLDLNARELLLRFPARFPNERMAQIYASRPEQIANVVYSARYGNGDYESGDGWRFRGRGLLKLRGRTYYHLAGLDLDIPLEDEPDRACEPETAALVAAREFVAETPGLRLADNADVDGCLRCLLGNAEHHAEALRIYNRIVETLTGVGAVVPAQA